MKPGTPLNWEMLSTEELTGKMQKEKITLEDYFCLDKAQKIFFERLYYDLRKLMKNEKAVLHWMVERNLAFDNKTPFQLIQERDYKRLEDALYHLRTGQPD